MALASTLKNHTSPDPTPMPIIPPDTAERDGRYSGGSHRRFFELYVIHSPLELKATSPDRGSFEVDKAI
jgi:hypothetical protein